MKSGAARYRAKHLRKGRARTAGGRRAAPTSPENRAVIRLVICGVIFVALVAVKLLFPEAVSRLADTAGALIGRDADFQEAFAAMGRAISGEEAVSDSLQDAYAAVFSPGAVTEENSGAETEEGAAEEGADICAFADGEVYATGESSTLGNYIMLEHPGGYITLYAHCSRVTATGGAVSMGDKIAEVGQTGVATGPHLHFELHDGALYYVQVR